MILLIYIDTHFQLGCTPYFLKFLNLLAKARSELIIALAVFHRLAELKIEKVARQEFKDSQVKYQQGDIKAIVEYMNQAYHQPVMIQDSSNPDNKTFYPCPLLTLFTASDLKAFVHWNQQKSIGSIVGCCSLCTVEGVRYQSAQVTIYIGAAIFLEDSNQIKKEYIIFN
jgi:hypothetical protein